MTDTTQTTASANLDPHRVPTSDWHVARSESEPRCGADQWRTRERGIITYMHEMTNRHLGHCIRFAATKPQHASRLASLVEEQQRRRLSVSNPEGSEP